MVLLRCSVSCSVSCLVLGIIFIFSEPVLARPLDPIPQEELDLRLGLLKHMPWDGKATESDRELRSGCHRSEVKLASIDPLTNDVNTLNVTIYRPQGVNKAPVVIVVPSIMGVTVVEPKIASNLCSIKMAAIIADVNETAMPSEMPAWGLEDRNNRRAILALRTLIDLAEQTPQFDRDRIGMIGVSLGGIVTAMMAGVEPERLKSLVVTVGGGNLPHILATSDNKEVSELRQKRMKHLDMNGIEEYEEALHASVRFDPMHFSQKALRDRIMMITARKDTKVPYLMQADLWQAFGRPHRSEYTGGHVETILAMAYWYFDEVARFLHASFGMPHQKFLQPPPPEPLNISDDFPLHLPLLRFGN